MSRPNEEHIIEMKRHLGKIKARLVELETAVEVDGEFDIENAWQVFRQEVNEAYREDVFDVYSTRE